MLTWLASLRERIRLFVHRSPHPMAQLPPSFRVLYHVLADDPPTPYRIEEAINKYCSDSDPLLHSCVISRVEFHKSQSPVFHEFLVCHVVLPSYGPDPIGYIRVERDIEENKQYVGSLAVLAASRDSGSVSSLHSLSPAPAPACDTVRLFDTPPDGRFKWKEPICSHTLAPDVSIPRLLAAAAVIKEYQTDYNLFKYQCYWFAGLLFRFVVGGAASTLAMDSNQAAELLRVYASMSDAEEAERKKMSLKEIKAKGGGCFLLGIAFEVVTDRDIDKDYDMLYPAYEERLQRIGERVLEEERKAHALQAAERGREAAERMAAEHATMRAEEAARREAAERMADEHATRRESAERKADEHATMRAEEAARREAAERMADEHATMRAEEAARREAAERMAAEEVARLKERIKVLQAQLQAENKDVVPA